MRNKAECKHEVGEGLWVKIRAVSSEQVEILLFREAMLCSGKRASLGPGWV